MNKDKNNAIHFTLFKTVGVYQMVDPSTATIFGKNVYHVVHITLIILTSIMTIYGLSGFFFKIRDTYENIEFDRIIIIFYLICSNIGNFKTFMIIINAHKIWGLLDVSHERFLTSRQCKIHFYKVVQCGDRLSKFFNVYFCLMLITLTSYAMIPIVIGIRPDADQTQHRERFRNAINMRFPVSTETYNTFYILFYSMECIMVFYAGFGIIAFDLLAMTIIMIISVLYEIEALAIEALEQEDNEDGISLSQEDLRKKMLSIFWDSQNIFKQLNIVFDIIRPISLVQILGDASAMILMPYSIILSYQTNGTLFNTETITFICTFSVGTLQSFLFCGLFQHVTDKKESLNFSIYSCDWTTMDIEIKKIILFKMRLNNSSDYLKIKVTPTKFIDLPFLAYIIRTSYSILSVMINKRN